MPVSNVNLAPQDWVAEQADIERRRKLADALQLQSQQPLAESSVGGIPIPISPFAGLAKMLQAHTAGAQHEKLTKEMRDLYGRQQQTYVDAGNELVGAITPRAAMPAQAPATPMDDEGNPQPMVGARAGYEPTQDDLFRAQMAYTARIGQPQMGAQLAMSHAGQAMLARALLGGGQAAGGAGSPSPEAGGSPAGATAGGQSRIPMALALRLMRQDPSGKSLMALEADLYKEQGKPVINRGFGIGTMTGPGGSYVPDQASGRQAAETAGAVETAKSAAGAPYSMQQMDVPVYLPGGDQINVKMTALQAHQYQTTGQLPPAIAASIPGLQPPPQAPQAAPQPMPAQAPVAPPVAAPMPAQPAPVAPRGTAPPPSTPAQGDRQRILQNELLAVQAELAKAQAAGNQLEIALQQRNLIGLQQMLGQGPAVVGRTQSQQEGIMQAGEKAREVAKGTEQGQLLAAQPQQALAARTSLANMDRLANVARELHSHEGLDSIVGKFNQYSAADVTPKARAARALQDTMVKNTATNALQAMREASKTGGAVGAVTEKEWPILERQIAALDGAQSTKDYQAALTNIQNQLTGAVGRIKAAYKDTYKEDLKYDPVPYETQGRQAPGKISGVRAQADAILGQR